MLPQISSVIHTLTIGLYKAIKSWPFWGIILLSASMLYKLNELDIQFNVGGMNQWKWAVNLGAILLACFWTLLLIRPYRAISLAVIDTLLTVILFADLIYFRYFKDFISIPVLLQAGQVGELQESIWSLIHPQDWLFFADLPFAYALAIWSFRTHRRSKLPSKVNRPVKAHQPLWRRSIYAAVLLALGWVLVYYPIEEQKNGWARGLFVGNWWNVPIYNVTGLFGFHGYDTYRYAKEHWFNEGISEEQKDETRAWFSERRKLQEEMDNEPLFGAYKGKNVLVVQAEALQSFVLGQAINGEEITPNLNKLLEQSIYFPQFYHQTAQGRTSDADFLTSCSMHPMSTGSVFIRFAGNAFNCAPSIFKKEGYSTTIHHSYDGSFWNRNNMYHNMQYDEFYQLKDYTINEPIGWSLGDQSFFRQAVDQLQERGDSPFYAMMITLSSHHPFKMPYANQQLELGDLKGTIMGDYLNSIHYVDSAIGVLVERLKEENLWDETILVLYGDHDNSITDWKQYEKFLGHPLSELDKQRIPRNVPFLIHLPQDENAGVLQKAVGQIDITPTLMHLLGIPMKNNYMMGVSMLSNASKAVVFRNGGFTEGELFFVPDSTGETGHGTCYNLTTGMPADDAAACHLGSEAANQDLRISDRVIKNNLLAEFQEEDAIEVEDSLAE